MGRVNDPIPQGPSGVTSVRRGYSARGRRDEWTVVGAQRGSGQSTRNEETIIVGQHRRSGLLDPSESVRQITK